MGKARIVPVRSGPELASAKELLQEYWTSFGFTPCFQNFQTEMENLPGQYVPPSGRFALAFIGETAAGCIAMRPLDRDRCEAKRLYVRPAYRGRGLGRSLLEWVICEARSAGYKEMLGDTMPVMSDALGMYERMGFQRIMPYAEQATPGAIYLRLGL